MEARGNSLLLRIRDKFFSSVVLRVNTGDGVLPFHKWCDVGNDLWIRGQYEETDRTFLRRLLPHFRCFVDVGANVGIYSLLAARHMPSGHVIAFEASPLEFGKLQQTIRWNRLDNVTAECMAVSDSVGAREFSESLDGLGALNRFGDPAKPNNRNRKISVRCVTLDSYFESGRLSPDFVKLDVERHELDVLRGATNVIQRYRPAFMIEMMWSAGFQDVGPEAIWSFLAARDYVWFGLTDHDQTINKILDRPLTPADLAHRRSVVCDRPYPSRNLYAIPAERIENLRSCIS